MATIGIDIGKRQHIAAIHHDGEREARKAVLRFGADRAGLASLSAWMAQQGEISRAVLESSGHYHLNLAAALQRQGLPVAVINPPEAKYFGKRPATRAQAAGRGGGRRIGPKKAVQPSTIAKDTIAAPELADQIGFQMRLLIAQHDLLEAQIAEAEAHLGTLLDGELVRRLRTIPGAGPAIVATLIAEIGDIHRFSEFDKLVAYIGVHPAEKSSGETGRNPETSWRMSKAGNTYLRTALYRMAVVGIQHNPVIRAHYARKRAQGKSKMNAVGHCMKKALAIVWGVWRSGTDFAAPPSLS